MISAFTTWISAKMWENIFPNSAHCCFLFDVFSIICCDVYYTECCSLLVASINVHCTFISIQPHQMCFRWHQHFVYSFIDCSWSFLFFFFFPNATNCFRNLFWHLIYRSFRKRIFLSCIHEILSLVLCRGCVQISFFFQVWWQYSTHLERNGFRIGEHIIAEYRGELIGAETLHSEGRQDDPSA